jgi:hypothetical protein
MRIEERKNDQINKNINAYEGRKKEEGRKEERKKKRWR